MVSTPAAVAYCRHTGTSIDSFKSVIMTPGWTRNAPVSGMPGTVISDLIGADAVERFVSKTDGRWEEFERIGRPWIEMNSQTDDVNEHGRFAIFDHGDSTFFIFEDERFYRIVCRSNDTVVAGMTRN